MHRIQLSLRCDVNKPVKSQTYTLKFLFYQQMNLLLNI